MNPLQIGIWIFLAFVVLATTAHTAYSIGYDMGREAERRLCAMILRSKESRQP